MASRTFDIHLDCGCLVSLDGGGGVIPCCYPGYGATEKEVKECDKAWEKYRKSKDFKKHEKEIQRRNS